MHFDRIFLLSHMRAYTSLAGHILGSHPRINGYYEMHLGYEDAAALDKQLAQYQQTNALKPESLERVESKILLSLAQPERTIKSIVHLYRQQVGICMPRPKRHCHGSRSVTPERTPSNLQPDRQTLEGRFFSAHSSRQHR